MSRSAIIISMLIGSLVFVQAESFAKKPVSSLATVVAKGKVNASEISGAGLHVVSVWDARRDSPIGVDGFFDTVILSGRPQKIFLKDSSDETRALAIVMPGGVDSLVFDARSTAQALFFNDSTSFRDSSKIEAVFSLLDSSSAFRDTVLFLKQRLPKESLESLRRNELFLALLNRCEKEIFGNDQEDIQESLKQAQRELEKVLP